MLHTRNTEKTLLRKTGEAIGGLVGASALLGIPTFVLFKRRRSYWLTRLNMKDADAQWDDAASQIVEIDTIPDAYKDEAGDAGEARGLLAES